MKRLRAFIESIVFAGLRPAGAKTTPQGSQWKWLGPLSGPVERLLSGGPAPTDPLYLTNRSWNQKIRSWTLIGIPCLVLLVAVGFVLSSLMSPPEAKPTKEVSASEIAAKMLPDMNKDLHLSTNHDVEVMDVKVETAGGTKLVGTLRNTTAHEIAVAEVIVDLTNLSGSQLGAVSATVEKLPANGTKSFSTPIRQSDAAFALVREVSAR